MSDDWGRKSVRTSSRRGRRGGDGASGEGERAREDKGEEDALKPIEMKATPARMPCDAPPSTVRKRSMTSSGDQTYSPKRAVVDEPMRMPMRDVMAKQKGSEMIWGRTTSDGLLAREAKSTAFVANVAMFAIQDMSWPTNSHPSVEPEILAGAERRSPAPFALTRQSARSAMPAAGAAMALRVKR